MDGYRNTIQGRGQKHKGVYTHHPNIYNIYMYPPSPPESLYISPSNYPIFLSNFEFGKHVVKFVFLTLGPTYEYIVPTQASSTHRERDRESGYGIQPPSIYTQAASSCRSEPHRQPSTDQPFKPLAFTHTYIYTEISLETSQGFTM